MNDGFHDPSRGARRHAAHKRRMPIKHGLRLHGLQATLTVNEEEANCLSATLLIPRAALLHFLALRWDDERIAAHFGVSMDLLRMRKNLTGVERQLGPRGANSRWKGARR